MRTNEYKNRAVVYQKDVVGEVVENGLRRFVKAYSDEMMCVENVFETGAVGALHSHPHTQISYIVSGRFLFTIGDKTYEVGPGDTLLKREGIVHGCVSIEGGTILDFFAPMRTDFIE